MIIVKRKYIPTDASVIRTMALAKGLAEAGCDVQLYYLQKNPTAIPPTLEGMLTTRCLSQNCGTNSRLLWFLYGTISLLCNLKKGDDVVLGSFILPLLWLLSHRRIRLYHERTEYPPFLFSKTFLGRFEEKLYLRICRRTAGIFVITKKIKEYYITNGVREDKVHVINMVVDSKRFQGLRKSTSAPYIAYCGTISNYKDGVNTLLKAFGIFHKNVPEVKLCIYGATPSAKDFEENKEIIKSEGIEKFVEMPGRIPAHEIPIRLSNATALVLARPLNIQSQYGFPTKLGEYLLTANPVVVTKVGELELYLTDKKSCIFAEPDNPEDLAKQLQWVFQHRELALEIGLRGKDVALQSFNYLIEAKKIAQILCK